MYTNENTVTNYKDYVITTSDNMVKGIFFRSPIQPIDKTLMQKMNFIQLGFI